MTALVYYKLAAIMATIALGWLVVRLRWVGGKDASQVTRAVGDLTMLVFVPALLFRSMVRLDLAVMPWAVLQAFFAPALLCTLGVYGWQKWAARRGHTALGVADAGTTASKTASRTASTTASTAGGATVSNTANATAQAAQPGARTVTAIYGNGVQLGIPMAAALFGDTGLALHIALVSVHGLILLTLITVLAEFDQARTRPSAGLWHTALGTLRKTLIHPVVLPVLLGLIWNVTGLGLHPVVDQTLGSLGAAVVPVCLVLIGMTLAVFGVQDHWRGALALVAVKLLVLPALVLAFAWGFWGLRGMPLQVVVMLATLPVGTNSLIFAQRYRTLEGQATAAIVMSTAAFSLTAGLWLAVLGHLA